VPSDLGVAFAVIMHLAPDRMSQLAQILGRVTRMPVRQVRDEQQIEIRADEVYVIAPDRVLEIEGSCIAAGSKAVKDAGGLVLVQEPSEATHDSMPRAAIANGHCRCRIADRRSGNASHGARRSEKLLCSTD
jgi:chemotaxis response regulator CheB